VAEVFGLDREPSLKPRYNVAPTQPVPIIRILRTNPETKQRELVSVRWGLVPSWADDPGVGNRLINARAETVASKPAFREAFKHRRCLVPADGFYEWKKEGARKQPVYVRRKDGLPFAFAGLWEEWEREGEVIESCVIITTDANPLMAEFHDRMPVILDPKDYGLWLDPEVQDPKRLEPLLQPFPSDELEVYPVSRLVNDPKHEDPKCLERQG
jgi:putative SOS response-associated peptidase YedK